LRPLPLYPGIQRDLALLVPVTIPAGDVEATIRESGGALLQDVAPFDLFVGRGIPDGTRSIAFRLHFRSPERTLTDDEVDQAVDRVLRALEQTHGVTRRAGSSASIAAAGVGRTGALRPAPARNPRRTATSYADRRASRAGAGVGARPRLQRRARPARAVRARCHAGAREPRADRPPCTGQRARRTHRCAAQLPGGRPMSDQAKSVVTVEIAGEEYTLRADTTPEYAKECAAHVDRTITEILQGGSLIQTHKAAILAALSLTDQLFQARRETQALRDEIGRLAAGLTADVRARLEPSDAVPAQRWQAGRRGRATLRWRARGDYFARKGAAQGRRSAAAPTVITS